MAKTDLIYADLIYLSGELYCLYLLDAGQILLTSLDMAMNGPLHRLLDYQ